MARITFEILVQMQDYIPCPLPFTLHTFQPPTLIGPWLGSQTQVEAGNETEGIVEPEGVFTCQEECCAR